MMFHCSRAHMLQDTCNESQIAKKSSSRVKTIDECPILIKDHFKGRATGEQWTPRKIHSTLGPSEFHPLVTAHVLDGTLSSGYAHNRI